MFEFIVLITSICAGFFTGLLGVGGGIIIFPAFLYIVPALGFNALSINSITGITTVQILTGSFSAYLAHRGSSTLDIKVLSILGACAAFGALSGAMASSLFTLKVMLSLYLAILVMAILSLTLLKQDECKREQSAVGIVGVLCYFSGFLAGSVGLAGAVLYIPMLRYFFGLTTKQCISNVSFIIFFGSIMTFVGKAVTAQIPYDLAIYTLVGSSLGAKIGAYVSKKLDSGTLKKILLSIISITAIRVFISLLMD